ncbi:MAG: MBL fold metallo-hydrolase [Roseburia sp.]|nr:MBL fold metallo-hydrolase [Roseburia sp.]MCM1099674.1 MBL fold metallo-hydrolase [Ruminococcus flavefaciens]
MKRIQVKQLNPHVYLMDDAGESTGYMVIGGEKALVIDTMNGHEDVKAVVREMTELPITVVNTHGHCDHIFGNIFFEEAYLHPADLNLAKKHSSFSDFVEETKEKGLSMPPFREIREGDVIDLGGLTVEIISFPSHTAGSILLLLREDRILFTGDAVNRHLWLQLEDSLPPQETLRALDNVMYLKEKADRILHGHAKDFEPISLLEELHEGLRELAEGHTEEDRDYSWFGGPAKQHPFGDGGSVIIYSA